MLKIGDFELYLINDATSLVDAGGAFGLVPRRLFSRYKQPDANNLITMSHVCVLVRVHGKTIVMDTGHGTKLTDAERDFIHNSGGLVRGLASLNIQPEDVDLVICTHLHGDHCGGNTVYQGDGESVQATFPNAEYVVQRREYEDAMHPNERTRATYHLNNYEPLVNSGQMRLLDGDTEFLPGIDGIVTPGHTPGHMSVRMESEGQHAAFICDMASYAVHFERLAWMTAYDVEPIITLETKRQWQQWALETKAALIFPHDKDRPIGRLMQNEKGWTVLETIDEPLIEA